MLHNCYLKRNIVYLPTVVSQGTAVYMEIEPVTVVPVADTEDLRRALRDTMTQPNAFVPPSLEDARKSAVLLKYTGDRSWAALMRGASLWSIKERNGTYQIAGHRTNQKGYWQRDPNQTINFAPG